MMEKTQSRTEICKEKWNKNKIFKGKALPAW